MYTPAGFLVVLLPPRCVLLAVRAPVLGCGVVVQSLRHQMQCKRVFIPGGFFDFGPFVLKPDFDLRLVKAKVPRQALPPLLGKVVVVLELRFQPVELLRREGRPGPLVVFTRRRRFLRLAGSGPLCGGGNKIIWLGYYF